MKPSQAHKRGWSMAIVGLAIVLIVVVLVGYRSRSTVLIVAPTSIPAAGEATSAAVVTTGATTAPAPAAGTSTAGATAMPAPAVGMTAPPITVGTSVPTTGVVVPTALPAAPSAHPTFTPPTPVADPRLQQAAAQLGRQMQRERGIVTSSDNCSQVLKQQLACAVYNSTIPFVQPEWKQLFPRADFFLVKTTSISAQAERTGIPDNWIVAQQDGQLYEYSTFSSLLDANGIVINDTSRELVAKAFVLMTLGSYVEDEVRFDELEAVDIKSGLTHYTYRLQLWTRLQGINLAYLFEFQQGRLERIERRVGDSHTGDYRDVPVQQLPILGPIRTVYNFQGK